MLKNNIKYNYNLGISYVTEGLHFMESKRHVKHRYVSSGFINRVNRFYQVFDNYLALTQSEEFLSLIENYFFKIRDDILNYINDQIKSIKKYYFDSDLYKFNFYYINQCSDEIYKISDNINNYFKL